MSYNHQNIDYWLTPNVGIAVQTPADPLAGVMVNLRPGYQPIMTVAIYAQVVVAPTVAATVLSFKFRPTIASATGEIVIGTLTVPIGQAIGSVVYKTVDNVKCLPGGEIVVQLVTGSTAGTLLLGLLAAPNWDSPGNNLKMLRSA